MATYRAAALYDGGWRSEDRDQLMQEYELTEQEADEISAELAEIEQPKTKEGLKMIIFANYDNFGHTFYRRNHGEIYDKIEVELPEGWKEVDDTPLFDLEAPWGDLYSTIDVIIDDHGPCLYMIDDKGEPYKRKLKKRVV